MAKLHKGGRDVLVVSSGSIALGRSRLKLPRGPLKLEESQAAAAVGQIALARIWSEVLGAHGIGAACRSAVSRAIRIQRQHTETCVLLSSPWAG